MSKLGKWIIRRGFLWHGAACKAGDLIELEDRDAVELLALNRIKAADDATAARVKQRPLVTWSASALRQSAAPWLPVSGPGDMRRAGRNY